MKRDMDLVREILITLSEANEPINASVFTSERYDYELVAYHFQIMDEAGLIEAKFLRADGNPYYSARAIRLTWQGNDFLSSITSDTVWRKVKNVLSKIATDVPLEVYKTTATKLVSDMAIQQLNQII